MNKLFKRV